jgi:Anti-sigma-K factor rskA
VTDNQSEIIGQTFTEAELEEALGAYALDAIDDPQELEAIEKYIASSPRARSEVDAFRHVAAAMGNAATDAPNELWTRIANNLPTQQPQPQLHLDDVSSNVVSLGDKRRSRRAARPWMGAAAAAATFAIAASGVAVNRNAALRSEKKKTQQLLSNVTLEKARFSQVNEQLETLRNTSPISLRLAQLESSPNIRKVQLVSTSGTNVGHVLLTPSGEGYIVGDAIPTLASGRTYQLWGVKNGQVLSLGVMGRSPKSMPFAGDEQWEQLVLTDEASPGVVKSAAPAAAVAKLDQA